MAFDEKLGLIDYFFEYFCIIFWDIFDYQRSKRQFVDSLRSLFLAFNQIICFQSELIEIHLVFEVHFEPLKVHFRLYQGSQRTGFNQ